MGKPVVLLVHYDPRQVKLLCGALESEGFTVHTCRDGETALKSFRTVRPDLVVVETMIPRRNGFEVCRDLKASEDGRKIPVVITSAVFRGLRYRNEALHVYGSNEFLGRGFSPTDLVMTVRRLLPDAFLEVSRPAFAQEDPALHEEEWDEEIDSALDALGGSSPADAFCEDPDALKKIEGLEEKEIASLLDSLFPSQDSGDLARMLEAKGAGARAVQESVARAAPPPVAASNAPVQQAIAASPVESSEAAKTPATAESSRTAQRPKEPASGKAAPALTGDSLNLEVDREPKGVVSRASAEAEKVTHRGGSGTQKKGKAVSSVGASTHSKSQTTGKLSTEPRPVSKSAYSSEKAPSVSVSAYSSAKALSVSQQVVNPSSAVKKSRNESVPDLDARNVPGLGQLPKPVPEQLSLADEPEPTRTSPPRPSAVDLSPKFSKPQRETVPARTIVLAAALIILSAMALAWWLNGFGAHPTPPSQPIQHRENTSRRTPAASFPSQASEPVAPSTPSLSAGPVIALTPPRSSVPSRGHATSVAKDANTTRPVAPDARNKSRAVAPSTRSTRTASVTSSRSSAAASKDSSKDKTSSTAASRRSMPAPSSATTAELTAETGPAAAREQQDPARIVAPEASEPRMETVAVEAVGDVGIDSVDVRPAPVSRPAPKLPAGARKNEGEVVLRLLVLETGSVGEVKVLRSTSPSLTTAAVSAAREWRYRPAVRQGAHVRTWITEYVRFNAS